MELEKLRAFGKKYLPSKKFAFLIGGLIVVAVVTIVVASRIGDKRSFNGKAPVSSDGTLGDVVTRDSNENGIADWEESLWGFDPLGNGAENKQAIEAKKASLGVTVADETAPNATDAFSTQLLATILALRQSGSLTPEVLAKVAASVATSADAKRTSAHAYKLSDIKLSTKNPDAARAAYEQSLKAVIDQYQDVDLGAELTIMAAALEGGGEGTLKQLQPLAEAYISLGRQIAGLTTPPAVAQNALDLANASAQMGAALQSVQGLYSDVIGGMVAMDDYMKANALSDAAATTLTAYFVQ